MTEEVHVFLFCMSVSYPEKKKIEIWSLPGYRC